jgi:hypothetical protein
MAVAIMRRTFSMFLAAAPLGVGVIIFTACDSGSSVPTTTPAQKPISVEATQSAPPSPWNVSTSSNELTGEITVTAINGYGDRSIVVRQKGKKLDCYVTTGRFLETVENAESRRSLVKYRFDDGDIVRQEWVISDDNEALFFPGNPTVFLQRMRRAKRFVIEYKPADFIAETASFDVSQFPPEFISEQVKTKHR